MFLKSYYLKKGLKYFFLNIVYKIVKDEILGGILIFFSKVARFLFLNFSLRRIDIENGGKES